MGKVKDKKERIKAVMPEHWNPGRKRSRGSLALHPKIAVASHLAEQVGGVAQYKAYLQSLADAIGPEHMQAAGSIMQKFAAVEGCMDDLIYLLSELTPEKVASNAAKWREKSESEAASG